MHIKSIVWIGDVRFNTAEEGLVIHAVDLWQGEERRGEVAGVYFYTPIRICDQHLPLLARSVQLGNSLLRPSTSCIPPPGIFPQVFLACRESSAIGGDEPERNISLLFPRIKSKIFYKNESIHLYHHLSLSLSLCSGTVALERHATQRKEQKSRPIYIHSEKGSIKTTDDKSSLVYSLYKSSWRREK